MHAVDVLNLIELLRSHFGYWHQEETNMNVVASGFSRPHRLIPGSPDLINYEINTRSAWKAINNHTKWAQLNHNIRLRGCSTYISIKIKEYAWKWVRKHVNTTYIIVQSSCMIMKSNVSVSDGSGSVHSVVVHWQVNKSVLIKLFCGNGKRNTKVKLVLSR